MNAFILMLCLSIASLGTSTDYVKFQLRNPSLKSIPLSIPGVMNPNLSPMSNSGVTLKVGQKILFRYNGKKRVLLIVDSSLEGQVLNVSKLIQKRKKELDAEHKAKKKKS